MAVTVPALFPNLNRLRLKKFFANFVGRNAGLLRRRLCTLARERKLAVARRFSRLLAARTVSFVKDRDHLISSTRYEIMMRRHARQSTAAVRLKSKPKHSAWAV